MDLIFGQIFDGGTSSILATAIGIVVVYFIAKKLIKFAILAAIGVAAFSYFSQNGTPDLSDLSGSASSTTSSATKAVKKLK